MSLESLQQNWEKLGASDPYWAILNDDSKTGNRWEVDEFFNSGAREVQRILDHVGTLYALPNRHRALDFGCGVGRLTQALADHFEQVDGVDISASMLETARKHNRHAARCTYWLNPKPDLSIFPAAHFTFIYSSITLQHMRARYAKLYLREFLRVLAPGGVLVFQLPAGLTKSLLSPARRISQALYYYLFHPIFRPRTPVIEMHPIPKAVVTGLLRENGAWILDISRDGSAGELWESYRYTVTQDFSRTR